MTAARRFRAYGLNIESDFEVGEADTAVAADSGLAVRKATIAGAPFEGFRDYRTTPEGDLLSYRDVGRFLVRGPTAIDVDLEDGFDARLIGLPLLGPVMALLLHRRGLLVLHGSAVLVGDRAQVFLGDKGAGKSTTAAALVSSGCRLVSDDVVAIERDPAGGLGIRPGYPAMKLDAQMLARFESGACRVLPPDDGVYTAGKSRVRLAQPVPRDLVPLGAVHCLARGSRTRIEALPPERKLHALIRFSHHPRLGPAANTPAETADLFLRAAALAPEIEVDVMTVKHALGELGQLRPFLEQEDLHPRAVA